MTVLSLFSGVGGIDCAVEHLTGQPTTHLVERDPFCQRILRRHFPGVPIIEDVREVGDVGADIVCGGPPCQAASLAGKQLGEADERWMWPDTIRVVAANRPRLALFENVAGLLRLDGGRAWWRIVRELDAAGYATRWDHAEAARAGAPHRRDRIWIVCVPHDRWTAPTSPEPEAGRLFGEEAVPAWTRAGWYAHGRWGMEAARWPRMGATLSARPTATVGDEKNARNRTSGRTNPNSTHADGETLCDAVEIEAGKWPTPRGEDSEQTGGHRGAMDTLTSAARLWASPQAHDERGAPGAGAVAAGGYEASLPVQTMNLWPTPDTGAGGRTASGDHDFPTSLNAAVKGTDRHAGRDGAAMWPTPDAMVANLTEDPTRWTARREAVAATGINGNGFGEPLAMAVRTPQDGPRSREERTATGALNPEFSGWLMGAYPGWTLPDGPPLPRAINGWTGGDAGLVYYRGRPAPKGMPLLTTDREYRRQRLKAHGNGVVPAQAVMAWSVLAGPWLPQR